jgi:hypothetical protein
VSTPWSRSSRNKSVPVNVLSGNRQSRIRKPNVWCAQASRAASGEATAGAERPADSRPRTNETRTLDRSSTIGPPAEIARRPPPAAGQIESARCERALMTAG